MYPLRIRFSLSIISILLAFTGTVAAQTADGFRTGDELEKFSTLGPMDASLLFKTAIEARGSYFSGLILIKDLPADSAIHMVFLSELGLNLLEMSYKNETFQVINVKDFLNRSAIIKTLQSDFQSILLDLSLIQKYKLGVLDDASGEELKFRYKGQRYTYRFTDELGTFFIKKRKGVFGKVEYRIKRQEGFRIGIEHRCIRLKIDLRELKKLEKNEQ